MTIPSTSHSPSARMVHSYLDLPLLSRFTLLLVMFSPAMPKLGLADGVYLYVHEVWLLVVAPVFLLNYAHWFLFRLQAYFALFTGTIFISTLVSMAITWQPDDLFRAIKPLLYLPIVGLAFQAGPRLFARMCWIALLAFFLNLTFALEILLVGNIYNVSPENLISGMSNRYFDLQTLSLQHTGRNAHGIWGSYCVLVFVAAHIAYRTGSISRLLAWLVAACVILSLLFTVSREAGLVLALVGLAWLFSPGDSRVKVLVLSAGAAAFILLTLSSSDFFSNSPLVTKILVKSAQIYEQGSETNISARLGAWMVFFNHLTENSIAFITGVGQNRAVLSAIVAANPWISHTAQSAESMVFGALLYGGIVALFAACAYLIEVWRCCVLGTGDASIKSVLGFFLIGIYIANLISGASLVSDMFMGQFSLLVGATLALRTMTSDETNQ